MNFNFLKTLTKYLKLNLIVVMNVQKTTIYLNAEKTIIYHEKNFKLSKWAIIISLLDLFQEIIVTFAKFLF